MGQLFVVNDCVTKEDLISYLSQMQILRAQKRRKIPSCNTNKSYKKAKVGAVSDKTPVTKITNFSTCELSSLSSPTSEISLQQNSSVMADFKCVGVMVSKSQCSHSSEANSMVNNDSNCYTVNKTVRKRKRVVVTEGEDKVENHLVRKSRKPCDVLKEKLKQSMAAEKRPKSELIIPKKDYCNNYNKISSVCIGKKSPTFCDIASGTCPDETFTLHENMDLCYQQNLGHNKLKYSKQPVVGKALNANVADASCKLKIRKKHVSKSVKGKQKAVKDIALSSECDTKVFSDGYFSYRNDQEIDICSQSCANGVLKSKDLDWTRTSRIDESFCLARVFDGESTTLNDPENNAETESASNQELGDTDVQLSSIQNIPNQMYVAVDCEMVGVGPKGKQSVLARCSIVDYDGNVIYDEYIRPSETITDYRTPWSGIRPIHMKTAVPIHLALRDIKECLDNKVVIGHAVYHDFKVLGMTPNHIFVRDTAQCYRLVEMARLQGRGNGLKKLSAALLDRKIQESRHGHCSVEDARATLDLFKLVRQSWEPELYLKWSKKDANICQKIEQFVNNGGGTSSYNQDFLDDKFWPSDVLD